MLYLLLMIIAVVCIALELSKRNILFLPLIIALFIVQLFIIVPGSDISSASYGNFNTYSFMGMSYSMIISIILILYCIFNTFIRNNLKLTRKDIFFLFAIFVFDILGIIKGNSMLEKIDMCAKINMPFIIYLYFEKGYKFSEKKISLINNIFLIINLILIIQVPICKVVTGKFSASTFYTYIMSEEYYGFYSSPHAFSALLGVLTIWNLKNINNGFKIKTNYFCLLSNVLLIFLSGVRTYALDVILAIIILFMYSFSSKKMQSLKKLSIIVLIATLLCSNFIFEKLATSRLNASYNTAELTSGRTNRWKIDLEYFENQNIINILIGNGFKAIYGINSKLIDVYINSLNVLIDLLIDNGIIGLTLIIYIYLNIFIRKYDSKNRYFVYVLVIYIGIGCFINNLLPYITVLTVCVIFLKLLELERFKEENLNEDICIKSTTVP